MGLGVSAAAAILFSAFIVIVGVAYTTVENTYDRYRILNQNCSKDSGIGAIPG